MRPNLAFGPIDSILQYLIYLSIVVLGVLLPLLVQKWRVRRENARLLARTLEALRQEVMANRQRLQVSLESFAELGRRMKSDYDHYEGLWHRVLASGAAAPDLSPPESFDIAVTLAAPTRTAWEVAQLSQALPLMESASLLLFTRVYQLQLVFAESRKLYLDSALKSEALEVPADLTDLRVVGARLEALAVAQAVVRYHAGLSTTLIAAYDTVLAGTEGTTS